MVQIAPERMRLPVEPSAPRQMRRVAPAQDISPERAARHLVCGTERWHRPHGMPRGDDSPLHAPHTGLDVERRGQGLGGKGLLRDVGEESARIETTSFPMLPPSLER